MVNLHICLVEKKGYGCHFPSSTVFQNETCYVKVLTQLHVRLLVAYLVCRLDRYGFGFVGWVSLSVSRSAIYIYVYIPKKESYTSIAPIEAIVSFEI